MQPIQNDESRCCERVREAGRWPRFNQCSRKWVVFRNGKHYCKIHDPAEVEKRRAAADEKWEKKHNATMFSIYAAQACRGMEDPIKEVAELKRKAAAFDEIEKEKP